MEVTMASNLWKIRPLEGKADWSTWKTRIEFYMSAAAADVMLGRSTRPDVSDTPSDEQQKKISEWEKADREAVSTLLHSVSDENLEKIARFKTARERWLELLRLYDGSAGERAFDMCMQFFGYSKSTEDDVGTHMSKLKNIWNELKLAMADDDKFKDVQLPDMFLECKVLDTLPESYFSFKSSWSLLDKSQRTIENLTERLCSYERSLEKHCTDKSVSEALIARTAHDRIGKKKPKKLDNSKSKGQGPLCYGCHEFGHIKKNCPNPKNSYDKTTSISVSGSGHKSKKYATSLLVLSRAFGVCSDNDRSAWYADTGASRHISNDSNVFESFENFRKGQYGVMTADGNYSEALGKGTVNVRVAIDDHWEDRKLRNVWLVPEMKVNLFSITSAQDRLPDSQFVSSATCCRLFDKDRNVMILGHRQQGGGLYKMEMEVVREDCIPVNLTTAEKTEDLQLWHERFGHQDKRHVQKFLKSVGIETNANFDICEGCAYGKAHRLSFGKRPRATKAGEIVHVDLCGPFDKSFSGLKYFICFKDDFTKYRSLYFLKMKGEAIVKLREFLAESKTLGHVIKELRCDNGGEFTAGVFRDELAKNGIKFSPSEPHTPEQNGSAERENRTIVESARAMRLAHEPFGKRLWAELTNTAVYVLNRTGPTGVDNKSPFELWRGQNPAIKHLRVIGTKCYVHVPDGQRKKMDSKAIKGYLIGYDDDNGYRVVKDHGGRELMRSRNVIFDKEPCEQLNFGHVQIPLKSNLVGEPLSMDSEITGDSSNDGEVDMDPECGSNSNQSSSDRILRDRSRLRKPAYLNDYVESESDMDTATAWCSVMSEDTDPTTFYEALRMPDGNNWKTAMDNEIDSLACNGTWKLVDLPKGNKAIDTKWVFKRKLNPDGSIDKYKARLVVRGFAQRKGVDFNDTFSPVARSSTIRMMISVAANEGMKLTQFDVSTAFLYGELDETIYVKQPEGYGDGSDRVCLLKRSLYGLKQAPRCWNKRFGSFMVKRGFRVSKADPCLFIRDNEHGRLLLALYVDDGLIAADNEEATQLLIDELQNEFKITVKPASYYLGLEIETFEDGSIKLGQAAYAKKVLEKFGMANCKAATTPIVKEGTGQGEADNTATEINFPYRSAVGALMYLAVGTRPDIAYAVSVVSRSLESPKQSDVQRVKRILRYLRGTVNIGINYKSKFKSGVLESYSDADHGGDSSTGRSTTGVVTLYSGGAVSWFSQRQVSVAISTTEAEVVAASEAARDIVWLKRLLKDITGVKMIPVLRVDNEAAIRLSENPEYHKRTKHIRIRHFFVREKVSEGKLVVKYVDTENQLADLFTKPMHKPRLVKLCNDIGVKL